MPNTEKIDELISEKALQGFDLLNEKLNISVANLEKMIATGVDLNKAFGTNDSFKKTNDNASKLAAAEKDLARMTSELAKAQEQMQQALVKQKEAETKAINDNIKALKDEGKAADDTNKKKNGGTTSTPGSAPAATPPPKSAPTPPPTSQQLFDAQVDNEILKIQGRINDSTVDLTASYSAEARQLAELKIQQQLVNKANKENAQDALGLIGMFDRLNIQYQAMVKNARNVGAEFGLDSVQFKEASKDTAALGDKLRLIDLELKQFGRNVGNYAGSLGGAFAVLQNELIQVKEKLKSADSGTAGFDNLVKQEKLLTSLTENLNKGFSSTRQELRAYTEAAKQLGQEVGLTSNTFIAFTDKVGETKNELDDIQKTLNYKASDTKYLDGAIAAVNGLAGVYGAAQGAAALFGDEDEQLQKQFVKLQALMTVITSLQAVQNALQTESGAIQVGLAAKTALLNAAMVVENALFKINTAVVVENAVAQEASAVATGEAAAAMEVEAAAATTATVATTAFRTALIATGIGAVIVAIAAAIVYLVSKIPAWLQGNALTIKQQQALAESVSKANEVLIAQGAIIADQNQQAQRTFTTALALSQAAGENQYKQLALQKQLAQLQKEQAKEEIARLGATNNEYAANGAAYEKANNRKMEAINELIELQKIPSKQLTSDQQRQIDGLGSLIDLYDKQGSAAKALYDAQGKARQDLMTANIVADQTEIATSKLSADERRKLILTEAGLEVAAVTNKNSLILSNDASTLAQRLKAIESNAAAQRRLQQAQVNDVKNNPSSTQNDVVIAERQQAEKVREINENLQKELFDLRTEYAIRDRLAGLVQLKLQLDDVAKTNDLIVDNDKKTFEQKTAAAYLSLKARLAILKQDADEELRNVKLTAEERRAIIAKNASDSADLTIQYGLKQVALYKANEALVTAAIEKEAKKRADVVSKENSDAIAGLNGQLISGNMNFGKYAKERADIEADNNIKAAQDAEKTEQAKTAATKAGTAERAAAEAELAKKQIALQDAIIAKEKLKQQEFIADLEKIKMYADTVLDIIGGILDASITSQKNALQDQSDAISAANQKEIDAINNSADTEEKKAARIAIVNARGQAQKEAIDRKQRQLDIQKAQFDKAKAIVDIILNTAIAVSKALYEGGPFLAAVYAAIGAAQLAVAIATPIPKFATGTADAPGGLAMVGDGGRSEMIVTPDGRLISTPDTPTVMNVPRHSVIFPDAEEFRNIGNGGRVPTLAESQLYYKDMTNVLGGKIDTLINTIKNKQEIHLLPRKDGWEKIKKGRNGSQTNYLNKV